MTGNQIATGPGVMIMIEVTTEAGTMIKIANTTDTVTTDTIDPEMMSHIVLEDARMKTITATTITADARNDAHP